MTICFFAVSKTPFLSTGHLILSTLKKKFYNKGVRKKISLRTDVECVRVAFPVSSNKGHDTHLASYTIAENKRLLGEIKIAGRETSS